MKRSFLFDTLAAENTGGAQDTTEQLGDAAVAENTDAPHTDAEGEDDENDGDSE